MDPKQGDLDALLTLDTLPVKKFLGQGPNRSTVLQSSETDFAVNDRNNIAKVFQREHGVAFLDFTLEEVLQLKPFLQAMGLGSKYLSLISEEETVCEDEGLIESSLTAKFKERAYDLLR
jgi:hypothetical protein